MSNPVKINS